MCVGDEDRTLLSLYGSVQFRWLTQGQANTWHYSHQQTRLMGEDSVTYLSFPAHGLHFLHLSLVTVHEKVQRLIFICMG